MLEIEEGEILDKEEEKLCNPTPPKKVSDPSMEESDVMTEWEREYRAEEQLGMKVRDDLANLVNGRFQRKLGDDLLKKRSEARSRPKNCTGLVVPTVNKIIWKQLPNSVQRADLSLARTQRAIVKSATAIATLNDDLLSQPISSSQSRADTLGQRKPLSQNERLKCCADAIAMLGTASSELLLQR